MRPRTRFLASRDKKHAALNPRLSRGRRKPDGRRKGRTAHMSAEPEATSHQDSSHISRNHVFAFAEKQTLGPTRPRTGLRCRADALVPSYRHRAKPKAAAPSLPFSRPSFPSKSSTYSTSSFLLPAFLLPCHPPHTCHSSLVTFHSPAGRSLSCPRSGFLPVLVDSLPLSSRFSMSAKWFSCFSMQPPSRLPASKSRAAAFYPFE